MNLKNLFLFLTIVSTILLSSCTQRLIDFTLISSKNVAVKAEKGKQTEGKSIKFLGIGANVKDAMDNALLNAGSGYDLLIDGVVRVHNYPFTAGYSVEGKAVKSGDLKLAMGEIEFENWVITQNLFDPNDTQTQKDEK